MDWLSHIPSDWSDVPFDNIAGRSTAPEPRPPISQLIDYTTLSTRLSEEPFQHSLLAQPSYNLLDSNPFDVRHAYHGPVERNEHQHIEMRDDLSRSNLMPMHSALPCSSCSGRHQPWPIGPPSGPPNTQSRPEKIE